MQNNFDTCAAKISTFLPEMMIMMMDILFFRLSKFYRFESINMHRWA